MAGHFRSFVVFAEMRTGSNFLESNLNALAGVACHGEAFNPHFIGYPHKEALLGVSLAERDRNPLALLERIEQADGLAGFRYFHDHDPRILERVLDDPRCAKIILTRDPAQSYVSWKIARATDQWKLTDVRRRKEALAHFDAVEFADYVARLAGFRRQVTQRLQASGQAAFCLSYDDLQSLDTLNGLARFLEVDARLEALDASLKVQNPEPLASKVSNPETMEAALSRLAAPDLAEAPDFEPRRFAVVPTYVLGAKTPLIYLPIRGGPQDDVTRWMAALDGVTPEDLPTQLSQKEMRQWKRAHPGHRSFTVVRHPLLRAHEAYCHHILGTGPQVFAAIRRTLVNRYGLPIPPGGPDAGYDLAAHKTAFKAFLNFLKGNLSGQSAIRVDPAWCTQDHAIRGFSGFAAPDLILREEELADALPSLAARLGARVEAYEASQGPHRPYGLTEIYDEEMEALAASAYQRDYMVFGFGRYR